MGFFVETWKPGETRQSPAFQTGQFRPAVERRPGSLRSDLHRGKRVLGTPLLPRSFDDDGHTHPRMDAALKVMFALRKTGDLELAALKDSRSGDRNARKSRNTLGSRIFSAIERRYEPASKLRNLRESVGLAALVHGDNGGSLVHGESVGFEVPLLVGLPSSGICQQLGKGRGVA